MVLEKGFVEIDGGAEGGQILRTSLSLSAILRKPFVIHSIRANRPKPGLQAQHLTAVNACAELCGARVEGNFLHAQELSFHPSEIKQGIFSFDIGTAGSTILVLQTLLPIALFAPGSTKISIEGGTENPFAPTSFYFKHVFLPTISKMGVKAGVEVEKFGWYPKGGGKIVARAEPCKKILPIEIESAGKLEKISGFSLSSNLQAGVRERMKSRALKQLSENSLSAKISLHDLPSPSTGAEFFLLAEFENSLAGFSALGELRKPAEKVAGEALHSLLVFINSGSALDVHLADQLLLYCSLAQGESVFSIEKVSSHLLANADVIRKFLPECGMEITAETESTGGMESAGKVVVRGAGLQATLV